MTKLKKALLKSMLNTWMKLLAIYKDEVGYMPIDTDSANLFFQLIAKIYEKHCIIITINLMFLK